MPRIIRPPEMWSSVAAVIAVIAGVRPGIWKIAEPMRMRSVLAASHASTVAVSEPYASAAQTESKPGGLGLAHDLELLLGRQAETPVPHVQTQAQLQVSFHRAGTTLKWPTARRTLARSGGNAIVWLRGATTT